MIKACNLVAVIDDDADLRAVLVQAIELEDLRVLSYPDAASALREVDRSFAGVIVTDLRMPGIDGSGLFARLSALDGSFLKSALSSLHLGPLKHGPCRASETHRSDVRSATDLPRP